LAGSGLRKRPVDQLQNFGPAGCLQLNGFHKGLRSRG
jgi:hypothetical protein